MIRQLLLVLLLLFVLGMDTGSPPLELPEAPAPAAVAPGAGRCSS